MARRSGYSAQKRRREADKLRKRREKAERRAQKRLDSHEGGQIEIATVEDLQGGALRSEAEVLAEAVNEGFVSRATAGVPVRLFVGGLSWDTEVGTLRQAFIDHGQVIDAAIVKDASGDSRGFGFVTIAGQKDAAKAIRKLDGTVLDGRRIAVKVATEAS